MGKIDKVIDQILRGTSDRNISFVDLCQVLHHLGFEERIKGSHHIFFKDGLLEIINLQPKDSQAKPYQVKQGVSMVIQKFPSHFKSLLSSLSFLFS